MSEKCKYCDYVSKCSRFCEYNSLMCLMHRSFPKIVDKTYEELEKENQELKQLIKENTVLVEDENGNYQELNINPLKIQQENQELKKQLKEYEHHLKISKEMLDLQGQDGNYNYDNYMLGLYNGMEYIMSLFEAREPIFKDGKNIKFLNDKNQQKDFIEWLEHYKKALLNVGSKKTIDCVLEKYKEIVGYKE